jgi:hypothetical protein
MKEGIKMNENTKKGFNFGTGLTLGVLATYGAVAAIGTGIYLGYTKGKEKYDEYKRLKEVEKECKEDEKN